MRLMMVWLCVLSSTGCNPFGPSCLERQQRGTVTAFSGQVAGGQIVSHVVPYGTDGSQNDVKISWPGQGTATAPRISVYATKSSCTEFIPSGGTGPCASIGHSGGIRISDSPDGFIQNSLIITNGRGNPDILGSPAEYKLWIVGDPAQSVTYSISITWFYGPDC